MLVMFQNEVPVVSPMDVEYADAVESEYLTDFRQSAPDSSPDDSEGSSSSESDSDYDASIEPREIDELRQWSVQHRVKGNALDGLLRILRRRLLPTIPKTHKTLLNTTQAQYKIEPMLDSCGGQGEFVYIGIEPHLKLHINPDLHYFEPGTATKLAEIDTNIDGLKVFKSSKNDAWVISCRIVDTMNLYQPFTVAQYYGVGKPRDVNGFLSKFMKELNKLSGTGEPQSNHGFTIRNQHYRLRLRHFICDTPARSMLKNVKSHTGYNSCERCVIRGDRQNSTTSFLPAEQVYFSCPNNGQR